MDPLVNFLSKFKTDSGKEEILAEFSSVDESVPLQTDRFFEKWGGGYFVTDPQKIPHDKRNHLGRISAYFDLFNLIKSRYPEKYTKIHKGTPYCILGWLFIDIGDYEQGVFYIDAAISEDIRTDPFGWRHRPACGFMFLDTSPGNDAAKRFTRKIKKHVKEELEEYNSIFESKTKHITPDYLVKKFVAPKSQEFSHRTLVCSLYIFILEAHKKIEFLKFRSENKGSIEPFLGHLHKGGLILESVMKEIYTSLSSLPLGKIFDDSFVKNDLNISLINTGGVGRTLEDIIQHLLTRLPKAEKEIHNSWLTLSLRLRNATSHSLLLPDVFSENTYKKLYRQILFSIFYLIKNKY
jgi:hypothetical protein